MGNGNPMRGPASILILAALTGGSFACRLFAGAGGGGDPEAARAMTEFNPAPEAIEESFRDLHVLIRDDPEAAADAAQRQLGARDAATRFAALYTLANTATTEDQLDALRDALRSDSLSERVLAAEALLARGEKEAIPAVIAALDADEQLMYSLPPREAWEYAGQLLLQFTEVELGLSLDGSLESSAAAKPAWEAWWDQNGDAVQWVAEEGLFR